MLTQIYGLWINFETQLLISDTFYPMTLYHTWIYVHKICKKYTLKLLFAVQAVFGTIFFMYSYMTPPDDTKEFHFIHLTITRRKRFVYQTSKIFSSPGLIPGFRTTNDRQRYFVTTSLIGWALNLNQPCSPSIVYAYVRQAVLRTVSQENVPTWCWGDFWGALILVSTHSGVSQKECLCVNM